MFVTTSSMEWEQAPIFRTDFDNQITIRSGSRFALNPYMNLNRGYYADQAQYNLDWKPPVPKWPNQTLQESKANTISDEILRQFARGAALAGKATTFFKTANQ